jgi:hypothetical protein
VANGRLANQTCRKYKGGNALLALRSLILSTLTSVIGNHLLISGSRPSPSTMPQHPSTNYKQTLFINK